MCLILQASCSSDEEITDADANTELVKEATNYLNGEIVLRTNATMNGVNKTLLPEGCPTKFKFEWSKSDAQTFTISLLDFTVGNMGMIINFKCDVKTMVLNSWEQKEYTGDGWIKFKGEDGSVWEQTQTVLHQVPKAVAYKAITMPKHTKYNSSSTTI